MISWWFEGCIAQTGVGVKPPSKNTDPEKTALCPNGHCLEGGLASRHEIGNVVGLNTLFCFDIRQQVFGANYAWVFIRQVASCGKNRWG